ncbi:glycerophosphodiester phosphodiesterase [Calidifontibacter sp. DB0510]|uniref:glycerophosphodiester phosphodiesterase n=1 Tax=Metallococcus carri TaxID=1656884 RepID=A0A967EHX9_9MICO|nr:glycerophosphodiester phosphodiesterase family protein [Metallococcus carri]NHN57363.1 glycerophosphodiester phosphodiesterase [Metallococcus carri]NOP39141.1 glycerophosphodiester phosphodiesterase [Calidifontibacter sp. DB2511S]
MTTSLTSASPPPSAAPRRLPRIVGHRGACGYRPELTLASFELAARLGADSVETDLVATKDHRLVCRHDNELSATTDIAGRPEFADRFARRVVDGRPLEGWFTEDFTLAELQTLRARERHQGVRRSNTIYDGRFVVPTLEELLDLRAAQSRARGRTLGVHLELKHSAYFTALGLGLESPVADALQQAGLDSPDAPVTVQSFEIGSLMRARDDLGLSVPMVFLTEDGIPPDLVGTAHERTYADLLTPAGLRLVGAWATGIGPAKEQVIPRRADGSLAGPTRVTRDAHDAGLTVSVWTFAAENAWLPTDLRKGEHLADYGNVLGEMTTYLQAGIDELITDHPDIALLARADVFTPAAARA